MSLQAYRSRMPSYASILNSDVFNFLIGPSRTRFGIHKCLLAAHSDVLKRVLDGHMRESTVNEMELADVEEDCFACFSEYLYTGEYPVPRPRELHPSNVGKGLAGLVGGISGDLSDTESYRKKPAGAPAPSTKKKASRGFAGFGGSGDMTTHDFTNVFITLAGLYVLAEKYNIQYLKHLALSDLSNQLKESFELIPSRRGDIVELIRYTYNNTYEPKQDTRSREVKEEGLRSLVSNYAALNLNGLRARRGLGLGSTYTGSELGGFDELITDGGDFIKDLVRKVAIDEDENRRYGNSLLDIPAYFDGPNGLGGGYDRSGMIRYLGSGGGGRESTGSRGDEEDEFVIDDGT
ncbi:hypothetical protein DRE_01165 [Drechslerella stenobrocha 248]|uniref:BTB domain-containing protein n=1 Tax=Drechslerella stenobrocha 248 TaxID=1043628 RepID=W7HMJ4_9PEZI|nr:hypothetical protein DRE_01165 [Drechslerella stenobrocha 248]